jgi:hypothetical protein
MGGNTAEKNWQIIISANDPSAHIPDKIANTEAAQGLPVAELRQIDELALQITAARAELIGS